MATIISKTGSIVLDGKYSAPKGAFSVKTLADGQVRITSLDGRNNWVVDPLTTTIDGVSFSDAESFVEALADFSRGDTGPGSEAVQSVTGDGVDNTDPKNPVLSWPVEVTWTTLSGRPAFVASGANAAAARTALGLGTAATTEATAYATSAQGALAETALQPGDAVDLSTLDARVPDGGTNGQVLKKDANGNNIWAADNNTTYQVITEAEFNGGSASTARTVSAVSLNRDIQAKVISYLQSLDGFAAGAVLTVNSTGDGLEWVAP